MTGCNGTSKDVRQQKTPWLRGFRSYAAMVWDAVKPSFGAEGGTRTPTLLKAADFESAASTDSATSAAGAQYSRRWPVFVVVPAGCCCCQGDLLEAETLGLAGEPLAALRDEHRADAIGALWMCTDTAAGWGGVFPLFKRGGSSGSSTTPGSKAEIQQQIPLGPFFSMGRFRARRGNR